VCVCWGGGGGGLHKNAQLQDDGGSQVLQGGWVGEDRFCKHIG